MSMALELVPGGQDSNVGICCYGKSEYDKV